MALLELTALDHLLQLVPQSYECVSWRLAKCKALFHADKLVDAAKMCEELLHHPTYHASTPVSLNIQANACSWLGFCQVRQGQLPIAWTKAIQLWKELSQWDRWAELVLVNARSSHYCYYFLGIRTTTTTTTTQSKNAKSKKHVPTTEESTSLDEILAMSYDTMEAMAALLDLHHDHLSQVYLGLSTHLHFKLFSKPTRH